MDRSPKLKQQLRLKMWQKVAIVSGFAGMAVLISLVVFNFGTPDAAEGSSLCGTEIKKSVTVNSNTTCSNGLSVKGGTLTIDADLILNGDLIIEKNGKLVLRKGASLTLNSSADLKVDKGDIESNGSITVDGDLVVEKNSNCTFNSDHELEVKGDAEFKKSNIQMAGNAQFRKDIKIEDKSDLNLSGTIEVFGNGDVLLDDSDLEISYGGNFTAGENTKFTMKDKKSHLDIKAGAYFKSGEADFLDGKIDNNGYAEQLSNNKKMTFDVSMKGNGVFYVKKKKEIVLNKGAEILNNNKSNLNDDRFIVGSNILNVLRLPKFKLDRSDIALGDSLVVEDTLDLNGEKIDLKSHKLKMPQGRSFSRKGNNTEYIETSGTGKYSFQVVKNSKNHIAPIGRNPYLPMVVTCDDCEGTEFDVAVNKGIYSNPDAQTGLQTGNAVDETWSLIPNKTFTGDITIELQWNAGANGTENSQLPGFSNTNITPVYWMKNVSTSWSNDGENVNVSSQGSDPYVAVIKLSGMSKGQEYLFGVSSGNAALPVEFSFTRVEAVNEEVHISWGTSSEENNDFFVVQRSAEGQSWNSLKKIQGAGTTLKAQEYNFTDSAPLSGLSFYRIKQVDFDGTTDYSRIMNVNMSNESSSTQLNINEVYPNPFNSQINLEIISPFSGNGRIALFDLNGNELKSKSMPWMAGENQLILKNLDALPSGYCVLVLSINGQRTTKRILKK